MALLPCGPPERMKALGWAVALAYCTVRVCWSATGHRRDLGIRFGLPGGRCIGN